MDCLPVTLILRSWQLVRGSWLVRNFLENRQKDGLGVSLDFFLSSSLIAFERSLVTLCRSYAPFGSTHPTSVQCVLKNGFIFPPRSLFTWSNYCMFSGAPPEGRIGFSSAMVCQPGRKMSDIVCQPGRKTSAMVCQPGRKTSAKGR